MFEGLFQPFHLLVILFITVIGTIVSLATLVYCPGSHSEHFPRLANGGSRFIRAGGDASRRNRPTQGPAPSRPD